MTLKNIDNKRLLFIFVNLLFTDTVMPANKNATLRYRAIDNLLCSEEWSTIEDMISVCEKTISEESGRQVTVSRVTIYKDIDFLSRLDGVKIDKRSGRPVRYRYARDSKTFNGTLVPSQSYADLEYTLEFLESISGLVSVDAVVKKLKRQLEGRGKLMQQLISFESNPRLRNRNLLWSLYRHIREGHPLSLRYNAAYMEVKDIDFQPWYLKQYLNRWFLMGWAYRIADNNGVRDEPGLRNLAIDRIEIPSDGVLKIDVDRLRSGNLKLNRPDKEWYVDFENYFSDIIGVSRYNEEPVEVILKADLNDMKSKYDWYRMNTKPVHTSQKVWVEDGTGYVSLTVRPNNELYSVLMTYANLEVISPQPVRDEMKRRIEHLLSHYR